ncbi:helix-turn-helix transcriptional regulator [Saccharopolyspora thermophila]|uniref:HTH cro/C1-type domain-containing protein n=1 Tax=Saccharopolyspora thermophila TaxID=89367 RepID=A0ABP3M3H9_9PSEU
MNGTSTGDNGTSTGDDAKDILLAKASTGARIKALRIKHGLTQRGLADRAHVSYSLLTKFESGARPASADLVAACARALGTSEELLAGRYRTVTGDDRLLSLMAPIRAALDLFDLPPNEDVRPRPLRDLTASVKQVNRLAQAARYELMAATLPGLLQELHTATHYFSGSEQQTVWALLAEAARCGHSVGIALGLNDLSVVALQTMDWAAARAGDQGVGLRAVREYLRVTAYLRIRDYETCWRLNAAGLAHLDGTDDRTPGALVARGQLHLGASIIAAYTGDQDLMLEHLAQADLIASRTGEQTEQFWLGFGPTNVAVHRVMALGAAGEHGHAVDAAEGLRFPRGWLPTRVGHHYLDLARALRWMNRPDQALEALLAAREAAPGQARRHPLARDTITGLVRSVRRRSDVLAEYAAWVGV